MREKQKKEDEFNQPQRQDKHTKKQTKKTLLSRDRDASRCMRKKGGRKRRQRLHQNGRDNKTTTTTEKERDGRRSETTNETSTLKEKR